MAGCTTEVSAGPNRFISEERLEEALIEQITAEAGQAPDDIDCPEGLEDEVGDKVTCLLTAGVDELDVWVEVTSVDGEIINFESEIGQVKAPEGGAS
ncbi:DUF4333 domain-containing protein [Nocardioides ferulae]|uniref:DUF4333 domain-containing protein n=1 Tax=Nocardioides ferulae TaxID=2340821 RepID=UPI0013DD8E49|nr:DUF4333 domain-containing protein [Nocardioides ferulae]